VWPNVFFFDRALVERIEVVDRCDAPAIFQSESTR
jgi:hypothetical protein